MDKFYHLNSLDHSTTFLKFFITISNNPYSTIEKLKYDHEENRGFLSFEVLSSLKSSPCCGCFTYVTKRGKRCTWGSCGFVVLYSTRFQAQTPISFLFCVCERQSRNWALDIIQICRCKQIRSGPLFCVWSHMEACAHQSLPKERFGLTLKEPNPMRFESQLTVLWQIGCYLNTSMVLWVDKATVWDSHTTSGVLVHHLCSITTQKLQQPPNKKKRKTEKVSQPLTYSTYLVQLCNIWCTAFLCRL